MTAQHAWPTYTCLLRTEHLYTPLPDARATPGDDCDFVSIPHACISHGLFTIAGHM